MKGECCYFQISFSARQIKSKLLVLGAVSTTINDQGCQHMTRRFESIRMPLNKSARFAYIGSVASLSKTVEWFKKSPRL